MLCRMGLLCLYSPGVDAKHNKDNCDYVRVEKEPSVESDGCAPRLYPVCLPEVRR